MQSKMQFFFPAVLYTDSYTLLGLNNVMKVGQRSSVSCLFRLLRSGKGCNIIIKIEMLTIA